MVVVVVVVVVDNVFISTEDQVQYAVVVGCMTMSFDEKFW